MQLVLKSYVRLDVLLMQSLELGVQLVFGFRMGGGGSVEDGR